MFATPRDVRRETRGGEAAGLAAVLGVELMPWQRQVLDTALEVDGEGRLAYRHVVLTVPRQNGKSLLLGVLVLHRMLCWGAPQQVTFAAQNVIDAQAQWTEKLWPLIERSPLKELEGLRLYLSVAKPELVAGKTGSRMRVLTGSPSSGHGMSVDLAVVDEAFSYADDSREVAAVPAMWARPDPQFWVVSTAGDELSAYLRRKVLEGRESVVSPGGTSAYFEWGLAEDADWGDEGNWPSALPALGTSV